MFDFISEEKQMLRKMPLVAALVVVGVILTPCLKENVFAAKKKGSPQESDRPAHREEVSSVLEHAQKAAQQWEFEVAETLLKGLEKAPWELRSAARKRISRIRKKIQKGRKAAKKARMRAQHELDVAQRDLGGWRLEKAASKLKEVDLDRLDDVEELEKRKQQIARQLEQRRKSLKVRQEKFEELLQPVGEAISEWKFEKAEETIQRAKQTEIYDVRPDEKARVETFAEKLAEEKETASKKRQDAISVLRGARKKLTGGKLDEAEQQIQRAQKMEAVQRMAALKKWATRLQTKAEKRREKIKKRKKTAENKLGLATQKIQSWKLDEAQQLIASVREAEIAEQVADKIKEAQTELKKARSKLQEYRSKASKKLKSAKQAWEEGDFKTARRSLQSARETKYYRIDQNYEEKVSGLRADIAAKEKLLAQAEGEARKKLSRVKRLIQKEHWNTANEVLSGMKKNRAVKRSANLQNAVQELRKKVAAGLKKERERERRRTAEKRKAESLLEQARTALQKWQIAKASAELNKAAKTAYYERSQSFADSVRRVREELDRAYAARREFREAAEGIRKALREGHYSVAESTMKSLIGSPVVELDSKVSAAVKELKNTVQSKVGAAKSAAEDVEKKLGQARDLIETRKWDKANSLLKDLEFDGVYGADLLKQERLDLVKKLHTARAKYRNRMARAEKIIKQGRTHMEKWDLKQAEEELERVKDMGIAAKNEGIAKRIKSLSAKLNDKKKRLRSQRKEAQKLVKNARKQMGAWRFQQTAQDVDRLKSMDIYAAEASLREKVEKLQEESAQKRKDALNKIDKTEAKISRARNLLAEDKFDAALGEIAGVMNTDVVKYRPDTKEKAVALKKEIQKEKERAREKREQKQKVLDHLVKTQEKMDQGRLDDARALLKKARSIPIYKNSPELQEKGTTLQQQIKKQAQQEKLVRWAEGKLEAARKHLSKGKIEKADSVLGEVGKSVVAETDAQVGQSIQKLRKKWRAAKERKTEFIKSVKNKKKVVEKWKFEKASELLDTLRDTRICKNRQWARARCAKLEKRLAQSQADAEKLIEKVTAQQKKVAEKLVSGEYGAAEQILERVKESKAYEKRSDIRKSVAQMYEKMRSERRKAVLSHWRAAQKAKAGNDYESVLENLTIVQKYGASVDGVRMPEVKEMRERASSRLQKCRDLYSEIRDQFEAGDYTTARKTLEKLRAMDMVYPGDIAKGMATYDKKIRRKLRERAIAQAQKYEEAIEEYDSEYGQKLARMRNLARRRKKAKKALQEAEQAAKKEEYSTAKARLLFARKQLEGIGGKDTPQISGLKKEIGDQLKSVKNKIAARKRRKKLRARLSDLFSNAESAGTDKPATMYSRLREALDFALHHGLKLSPGQKELAMTFGEQLWEYFAESRASRGERYWSLTERARAYRSAKDVWIAGKVLEIVKDADGPFVESERDTEFGAIRGAIENERERMNDRLKRVKSLQTKAEKLLETGDRRRALKKYRQALEEVRDKDLPVTELRGVLEGYQKALRKYSEDLIRSFAERLDEIADNKIGSVLKEKNVLLAEQYLKTSSYRFARDLLKKVKEQKGVPKKQRQWAASKLKGLNDRIQKRRDDRLLALKDEAAEVYALQKKLDALRQAGDRKKVQRLEGEIQAARRQHLVKTIEFYLKDNSIPSLSRFMKKKENIVAASKTHDVVARAVKKVRRWRQVRSLLQELAGALEARKAEKASELSAKLGRVGARHTMFARLASRLQDAASALMNAEAQRSAYKRDLDQALATVQRLLRQAKSRKEKVGDYLEACSLYAEGYWEKALGALKGITESPAGLQEKELDHAATMISQAQVRLPEARKEETRRDARGKVLKVRQYMGSGEYKSALEVTEAFQGNPGYNKFSDMLEKISKMQKTARVKYREKVAKQYITKIGKALDQRQYQRASELIADGSKSVAAGAVKGFEKQLADYRKQVQTAEEKASQLYAEAAAAYEAGESQKLEKKLDILKERYRHTKVYAENM